MFSLLRIITIQNLLKLVFMKTVFYLISTILLTLQFNFSYAQEMPIPDTLISIQGHKLPCFVVKENDQFYFVKASLDSEEVKLQGKSSIKKMIKGKYEAVDFEFVEKTKTNIIKKERTNFDKEGSKKIIVNGVDINQLNIKYCEILGVTSGITRLESNIIIDYGQTYDFYEAQAIENENGKEIKFNSIIDALNYMSKSGWKYVISYSTNFSTIESVYHILLEKNDG